MKPRTIRRSTRFRHYSRTSTSTNWNPCRIGQSPRFLRSFREVAARWWSPCDLRCLCLHRSGVAQIRGWWILLLLRPPLPARGSRSKPSRARPVPYRFKYWNVTMGERLRTPSRSAVESTLVSGSGCSSLTMARTDDSFSHRTSKKRSGRYRLANDDENAEFVWDDGNGRLFSFSSTISTLSRNSWPTEKPSSCFNTTSSFRRSLHR
mmetsp:Transcript_15531/g.43044  ORF Transcript_15531/g.43044 Transcript_15531/m.43044 type:complete len:207 (-) Transcript_15531:472-1092(-)